jgi:hypothetical protein
MHFEQTYNAWICISALSNLCAVVKDRAHLLCFLNKITDSQSSIEFRRLQLWQLIGMLVMCPVAVSRLQQVEG